MARYLTIDNKLVTKNGKLIHIDVDVVEKISETKTITPTRNQQTITPTDSDHELVEVTVEGIPNEYITPTGTLNITTNGTHDVTNYEIANVSVTNQEDRIDLGNFIGTVGGLWRVNLVQADGSSLFTGYYMDFSKGNIDDVENAPEINATGILKPINCVLSASTEKVKTYLEGEYMLASVESEGQKQYIVEIMADWATNFWGEEINVLLYDPATNTLSNPKGTYFLTKTNTLRLQDKTVTENGDVEVDAGLFDGLGVVTVNVPSNGITPSGMLEINENGTHDVTNYASANVNVISKIEDYINLLVDTKWEDLSISSTSTVAKKIMSFKTNAVRSTNMKVFNTFFFKDGSVIHEGGSSGLGDVDFIGDNKITIDFNSQTNYTDCTYEIVTEWDETGFVYRMYLIENGVKKYKKVDYDILDLQEKTVTPSTSRQVIVCDNGYDGLKKVIVEGVNTPTITYDENTGTLTINNGD